eukprot:2339840-Rhodomonas_salina.7
MSPGLCWPRLDGAPSREVADSVWADLWTSVTCATSGAPSITFGEPNVGGHTTTTSEKALALGLVPGLSRERSAP